MPTVREDRARGRAADYKFSAILTAIAESEPFRFSTIPGTDGELETHAAAAQK